MKTLTYILLFFVSSLLIFSCENNDEKPNSECDNFLETIIYLKSDSGNNVVDILSDDLNPEVTENDQWGHKENIDLLIDRLNMECENISVGLGCYACIYTLPPQSELIISTDSAGVEIKRVIDILTPKDDILQYLGVHRDYGD